MSLLPLRRSRAGRGTSLSDVATSEDRDGGAGGQWGSP